MLPITKTYLAFRLVALVEHIGGELLPDFPSRAPSAVVIRTT
jgi:hypothetical protein